MKIAILYDDGGSKDLNLTRPDLGNPGVGGTQFCFLMLIKYYKEIYKSDEIVLYHTKENGNIFWDDIDVKLAGSIKQLPAQLRKDGIDICLINSSRVEEMNEGIVENKIKTVVWVHNFIFSNKLLSLLKNNEYIKRIIFVGREQYDRYMDDLIINKSIYIFNMFNASCKEYTRVLCQKPIVTYTGAIIKGKGFHALAKQWKYVLKNVPDAQLYVIGSGSLYDRNVKLGKYGIASEEYENLFIPYLLDNNGKLLDSVHFLGILGAEKVSIYQKTKVGVINPTARTEICPLSAIEMEACGIPVVSKYKNGMPDVIEHSVTGLLAHNEYEFKNYLVELLTNDELNHSYSVAAKRYVAQKFAPEKIIKQWKDMFYDVMYDRPVKYIKPSRNWSNNLKWLRYVNRSFRKKIPLMPSLVSMECTAIKIIRGGK